MAIQKAFVVKNSLEVSKNLIFANSDTKKVGIGSTNPQFTLDVAGGIGVTNLYSSGVGTFISRLDVGTNGNSLRVFGAGGVGIGTNTLVGSEKLLVDGNQIIRNGNLGIRTTNPSSTLTVNGDVNISGATTSGRLVVTNSNSTTTGGGQIYLNGETGNRIDFNGNGASIPSFTTRSVGTKLVLYPNVSSFQVDYALGISPSTLWYSIPETINSTQHRWYAGITTIADLKGSGELVLGGVTTLTGTSNQKLQVTGGAYVSGNLGIGSTNPAQKLVVVGNQDLYGYLNLPQNPNNVGYGTTTSSPSYYIGQLMGDSDSWKIYGESPSGTNTGTLIFEVSDDVDNSERFSFRTRRTYTGVGGTTLFDLTQNGNIMQYVPLLIGTATTTGTASQPLQVNGGAYIKENLGIGTTNPQTTLDVLGNLRVSAGSTYVFGTGLGIGATFAGFTNALSIPFTSVQIGGTAGRRGNSLLDISGRNYPDGINPITIFGYSEPYTGSVGTFFPFQPAGTVMGIGNFRSGDRVGIGSTLFGKSAVLINFSASNNTFHTNVFIGAVAGDVENESANFVIGRRTGATSFQETVRVDTTGNVGIGTTTPTSKLHVVGNVFVSGALTASNIITGIGIRTSNTAQPLGVGVTILEISGAAVESISVSSGIGTIVLQDKNTPVSIGTVPPSGVTAGNLWYNSNDGRTFIYYNDGDSSQWVDLAPDNNSLGSATLNEGSLSNLSLKFTNNPNTGFYSPSNGQLTFVSNGENISDITSSGISLRQNKSLTLNQGNITNVTDIYSSNVTIGNVTKTGTSNQPLQVFGGGYIFGNLGVGVTNPSYKVDVSGSSRFTSYGGPSFIEIGNGQTGNQYAYIDLVGDTTYTDYGLRLIRENTGPNAISSLLQRGTGELRLVTEDVAPILFYTANSARCIVTSGGDVGIGTINPVSKLQVIGNVTATDFNSTSDINLKQDISTIDNALSKTQDLRGVKFNWKETNRPSYGVIAQELEKVLPELVSDGDPKTVNYNGLIGLLIEAVKELSNEVEELKSLINQ